MNPDIRLKFLIPRVGFTLDVDTEIPGQGVTAFFGRSGSGKTSVLRCIAGLDKAENALLSVQGKIWQDSAQGIFEPTYNREIGYVFQEGALFPHLSVKKNLLFGFGRTPKSFRKANFSDVVELLGLNALLHRLPLGLSGGEKQRVAIGRALLNHPRLLLMDEPMASLDQIHKKEILPYLENLHQNVHIPIIYITHDREELIHIADYLVLMEQGKIIAQGPLDQIMSRVDLPIARDAEAASVMDVSVVDHDPTFHLTKLAFAGGELYVNGVDEAKGSRLRIRILARDVSIALDHRQNSSILNVLPAMIEEMQVHGKGRLMVRLNIGGVPVLARITQKSQHLLGIKVGDPVFAEIKSVALL
jgi:molybdate transport system ATP-binding protein